MHLSPGNVVRAKGHDLRVTELDARTLPLVRAYLIGIAKFRGRVTYGEMRRDLALPHAEVGMGRLLDLLSVDCCHPDRDEPSLAALVVNQETDEVGEDFVGNPVEERRRVYDHWA